MHSQRDKSQSCKNAGVVTLFTHSTAGCGSTLWHTTSSNYSFNQSVAPRSLHTHGAHTFMKAHTHKKNKQMNKYIFLKSEDLAYKMGENLCHLYI